MKFDADMLSLLLAALVPFFCVIAAIVLDRKRRQKTERPPQAEKLLRPPGYSLAQSLDSNMDKMLDDLFASCGLSAIAGLCAWVLAFYLSHRVPLAWGAGSVVALVFFATASAFFAVRGFRRYQDAQNMKLGLRGEQAVAEALHEAAESGFRAFHDLQTDKVGNLDHVAVGSRGVFVIETKARRRRSSRNGQPEHEVVFDGESLKFPNGNSENAPIKQAQINAKWLSNYLSKKTGEAVRVQALVVLPGWFVRFAEKGDFSVKAMNANYLVRFLQSQPESVQSSQVRRIITALDERCRDVEF